jgi:hypothetical protein
MPASAQSLLLSPAPVGVLSTGHCHPRVVAALQQQAGSIIMAQQNIFPASRPMVDLLQRLDAIMPPQLTSHFFCNSGAGEPFLHLCVGAPPGNLCATLTLQPPPPAAHTSAPPACLSALLQRRWRTR